MTPDEQSTTVEDGSVAAEALLEEEEGRILGSNSSNIPPEPSSPNTKITIFADIPSQRVRKGIRLLPTQTLASFVEKLQKKKVIPNTNGEISIIHTPFGSSGEGRQVSCLDSQQSIWELGIRDQDGLTLILDATSPKSNPDLIQVDKPAGKDSKKKESLLNRFRSAAAKTLRSSTSTNSLSTPKEEDQIGLLFGIPLEIVADMGPPLMADGPPGIPAFIKTAFDYLKASESQTEGLFRLSGSSATIKSLKKLIDRGENIEWEAERDAHNATGLIKMYLRELPEPLLTFALFDHFYSAVQCVDKETALSMTRSLLLLLPVVNFNLIKFIVTELVEISHFEEHTKMGIVNLATLFGPNIGRPETTVLDQQEMLKSTSKATAITSFMLFNANDHLFDQATDNKYRLLAKATFDYEAIEEDELELHAGEAIFVTECEEGEGWWAGQLVAEDGALKTGRFPSNYVQVVRQNDAMISMSISTDILVINKQSDDYEPEGSETNLEGNPDGSSEIGNFGGSSGFENLERSSGFGNFEGSGESKEFEGAGVHEGLSALSGLPALSSPPALSDPPALSGPPALSSPPALSASPASSVLSASPAPSISPASSVLSASPAPLADRLPEERMLALETELALVKLQLAEESKKRQELAAIIPELLKNQDEVLKLLQTLNT